MGLIESPWVGGRPMLPDGLPLIDRVPEIANAYVATGHGMLGVTLAPTTASALGEFIDDRSAPGGPGPVRFCPSLTRDSSTSTEAGTRRRHSAR